MKGMITVLALLLVLGVLFFLRSSPPAQPQFNEAEIAAEVDSVTDEAWRVWSTGEDFDRFMTFFADDPETLWISNAVPRFGRAEIDAAFRPTQENLQRQDNTAVEWRTIVIAPDVVYTVRINDITQTDFAGNSSPVIRYAETLVWVKRDGEWKVLIGHGSTPNESM